MVPCIVAAIVYGILHNQVTARVCVKYFTIGHPPIFHTDDPTPLAFAWAFIATSWMGAILSISAVLACRVGSWPKFDAANLVRPVCVLLIVTACCSLLAGIAGYFLAKAGAIQLMGSLAHRVPPAKHVAILADGGPKLRHGVTGYVMLLTCSGGLVGPYPCRAAAGLTRRCTSVSNTPKTDSCRWTLICNACNIRFAV